jgi:tRNA pseudouridine55 synthase
MINESVSETGVMLLIDKPKNYTSARVVNIIKKKLNIKKAGHSGTLDPLATGLMIVCTGKMTSVLNQMLNYDKEYEGVMVLGESTRSYDLETSVISKKQIDHLDEQAILDNAKHFRGEIQQLPPMYSAVKHRGKPLYKYARKNIEIERKPRKVLIKEFRIKNVSLPEVFFVIVCSKGTYIRTLVNDFGEKLGIGAYLKELRRTRIGNYEVKDSFRLDDFFKTGFYIWLLTGISMKLKEMIRRLFRLVRLTAFTRHTGK